MAGMDVFFNNKTRILTLKQVDKCLIKVVWVVVGCLFQFECLDSIVLFLFYSYRSCSFDGCLHGKPRCNRCFYVGMLGDPKDLSQLVYESSGT